MPLALFVFVALSIAAQPLFEPCSAAGWSQKRTGSRSTRPRTRTARALLFRDFTRYAHADPAPPAWATLLFENHPTILDRIRMAEAWRARSEGRSHP